MGGGIILYPYGINTIMVVGVRGGEESNKIIMFFFLPVVLLCFVFLFILL